MTTLLFLGAGASRPFEIPTMVEMVNQFEQYLEKENIVELDLYKQVKELLSQDSRIRVDIESIFSIIDGIAREVPIVEFGMLPYYHIKKFGEETKFSPTEVQSAKKLKEELEKFVRKVCTLDVIKHREKIYTMYDALFSHAWGITDVIHEVKPVKSNWKAYTTNYDVTFEEYWKDLGPIQDFFVVNQTQYPYFDRKKNIAANSLTKIHGSINWWEKEDGTIIKSDAEPLTRMEKKGIVMLYPIQQKDLYAHPWITLFQEFKNGLELCNLWYVIGYAFNDPFVFDTFVEGFKNDKRMVIINPHAPDLKKKFSPKIQENIIALPIKFGDKYFPKDFEDFKFERKTLEFQIKTDAPDVKFEFSIDTRKIETIEMDNFGDKRAYFGRDDEGRPTVEFRGQHTEAKKLRFRGEMSHEPPYETDLVVTISSSRSASFHMQLLNQERIIHTFSSSTDSVPNNSGMYQVKTTVLASAFFPKD